MRIVVTTCPAYAHLLDDFDFLYQKFWGEDYTVIGKDVQMGYADSLILNLGKMDDEYIILLHEDFYFTEFVDTGTVQALLGYAREHHFRRVSLQCVKDGYEGHVTKYDTGLYTVNPGFMYVCSLEASIWHRETLINNVLVSGENVWQSEVQGSKRNPSMNVLVPETRMLVYSDARIHGRERIKVINSTFHKLMQAPDGSDLWEDLGIERTKA